MELARRLLSILVRHDITKVACTKNKTDLSSFAVKLFSSNSTMQVKKTESKINFDHQYLHKT